MTTTQLVILARLITAHILADFFLQPYRWIVHKRTDSVKYRFIWFHVIVIGALTYLLLADWTQWQLPLFIMATHFLIDLWKSNCKDKTVYFLIDQLLHILMILVAWFWYIGFDISATWHWLKQINAFSFWVILAGYLLLLRPVGFLVGKATKGWQRELESKSAALQGLDNAGTWIGYLERVIILTIFLIGQYSAVGFLIAAKSIFRFSGKTNREAGRRQAEYILIGTLMSFFVAIVTGIVVRYLMNF